MNGDGLRNWDSGGDWRDWVTRCPSRRRLAGGLAIADAFGIAAAVAVIAVSLVSRHAVGGVDLLWIPGALLLAAGQVWAIAVGMARRPPGVGRKWLAESGAGRFVGRDLGSYFGPLDRRITRTVTVLFYLGALSFITSIFFTWHGTPGAPGGGCAYRLVDHASYTCVSKTVYGLAGGAVQRIAAGVFLSFYAIHLYAALASRADAGTRPTVSSRRSPPRSVPDQ